MKILGIETSCDETAAAIIEAKNDKIKVLSNVVSSQIKIHQKYGGVVPEVAAREHVPAILPVIEKSLAKAGIKKSGLAKAKNKKIDAIAVTIGPGLITSLIVGIETAKVLSCAWNIPVIGVSHIEGHIYANYIKKTPNKYPCIILTVSGGHTMLILMKSHGRLKTIGQTRDDAAGEAFDKAAQLLGLGYPGGPIISQKAALFKNKNAASKQSANIDTLPRPMINSQDFDFSFSGLKTALLYALQKDKDWKNKIPDYAHEFQQAIIDVLISKTIKAANKYNSQTIMLSGGVAANQELRKQMTEAGRKEFPLAEFKTPDLKYTTDNAAMIATAGYFKARDKKFTPWQNLKVDCNLKL